MQFWEQPALRPYQPSARFWITALALALSPLAFPQRLRSAELVLKEGFPLLLVRTAFAAISDCCCNLSG